MATDSLDSLLKGESTAPCGPVVWDRYISISITSLKIDTTQSLLRLRSAERSLVGVVLTEGSVVSFSVVYNRGNTEFHNQPQNKHITDTKLNIESKNSEGTDIDNQEDNKYMGYVHGQKGSTQV